MTCGQGYFAMMRRTVLLLALLSCAILSSHLLAVSMPLSAAGAGLKVGPARLDPDAFSTTSHSATVVDAADPHLLAATSDQRGGRVASRRSARQRDKVRASVAKVKGLLLLVFAPRNRYELPNGMAVAGFVLSLSFLFTSFIGPLLGIIFSAIALSRANRYPEIYGRRNMALAGLVTGVVMFAILAGALYAALLLGGA